MKMIDFNNLASLLAFGKKFLKDSSVEQYALDCELIMMHTTGFSKVKLFTENNYELSEKEKSYFLELLKARAEGKPVQYILGKCEFMSLPFYVNENVLIPRNDTETLVEEILNYIKNIKSIENIFDMCTGSGCIPISILKLSADISKNIFAYASDISENALETAEKNAVLNKVDKKIKFIKSDLFQNIEKNIYGKIDIFTSNPPYIKTKEIETLMREVKNYEPVIALNGGEDGLDFYKIILSNAKLLLKKGGLISLEIGFDQAASVSMLMEENGFYNIKVIKDLAGLDRVVLGVLY